MKVESMQRPQEPKFEMDEFTDLVYDKDGKGNPAKITYEGYYYGGTLRLVNLIVAIGRFYDGDTEESVINLIQLREGKNVTLECKMELA